MRTGSSLWLFSTLLYMRIVQGKNNYILLSERQDPARGLTLTRMLAAVLAISLLSFYVLSISSEDICWAAFVPVTLVSQMKKTKFQDHPAHWGAAVAKVLDTMVIGPSFGCRITCPEGFPLPPDVWEGVHLTSFHSVPPPEGPTTPNSDTSQRPGFSQLILTSRFLAKPQCLASHLSVPSSSSHSLFAFRSIKVVLPLFVG